MSESVRGFQGRGEFAPKNSSMAGRYMGRWEEYYEIQKVWETMVRYFTCWSTGPAISGDFHLAQRQHHDQYDATQSTLREH